uniref:Uncharacterized protein n=1 Tax=Peronospora matthiolae TaxID=2874970 RepID=A0AAV1V2K3_9STRA
MMNNVLQQLKDRTFALRETLLVRVVSTILTPFILILGMLMRSHDRKGNGERAPGLTRYRQ